MAREQPGDCDQFTSEQKMIPTGELGLYTHFIDGRDICSLNGNSYNDSAWNVIAFNTWEMFSINKYII